MLLKVLDIINIIFIIFTSVALFVQLVYVLLFWVRPKHFKSGGKINKVCILIPARNEEGVIANIVKNLQKQNYDKDKFEIVVIAHNCTDNTAKFASEAGAKVFEYNNSSERNKAFALKHAFSQLLDTDFDFFLIFDADNLVKKDYIDHMNNAFNSGVLLARGYNNSKNFFSNVVSSTSSLYYIRDARLTARVRERFSLNNMLLGTGQMMAMEYIKSCNGFPSKSISEDADITCRAMLKGYRVHYVGDAEFYEEHPTTFKDLFARNMRMGKGLIGVFFKQGFRLLGKFFTTLKFTYLDMFMTLMFVPIAIISSFWFVGYYSFLVIKALLTDGLIYHMGATLDLEQFAQMAIVIVVMYFAAFIFQAILAVVADRKRLPKVPGYKFILPILATPIFMLIYSFGIAIGAICPRIKWKAIRRNKQITIEEFEKENGIEEDKPLNKNVSKEEADMVYSENKNEEAQKISKNLNFEYNEKEKIKGNEQEKE